MSNRSNKIWTMRRIPPTNSAEGNTQAGEVLIYGTLSEDKWWEDDVTPTQFREDLKALGDITELHVRINSYGGHVSAGAAIYATLKQHPANVIVHIDGFALSAASVVAMAGDTVIMPGNAMMMIHNPATISWGDANALRKEADALDKMRDAMIAVYADKTGLEHDVLAKYLDEETWLNADEAVELGFADVVEAPLMAVACVKPGVVAVNGMEFDLTSYRNTPPVLLGKINKEEKTLGDKNNSNTPATGSAAPVATPTPAPTATPIDRDAVFAEGRTAGVAAERARQKAIDELAVPGMEEVIAKAKYETGDSAETVAMAIVRAQKQAGTLAFNERKTDAEDSGVNDVPASATDDGIAAGEKTGEKSKALNDAIKKARGIE